MSSNYKAIALLAASLVAVSPTVSAMISPCCVPAKDSRFFVLLGTGYSFSRTSDITPNLALWDPAVQGYSADLNNSPLYTAGLGYEVTPLIDLDIEVTSRPSFSYSKFQTSTSAALGTLGNRSRKFDLTDTSIMANAIFNGRGVNLFANLGCNTILQPFVGGGVGIAYNTVSNFHTVLATTPPPVPSSNNVLSIMNSNTVSAFAWQVLAGLEVLRAETWGFDLGYRYFNGGSFKTNNYLIDVPVGAGFTNPVTAPAWKGKLSSNEVFFNIRYLFNK